MSSQSMRKLLQLLVRYDLQFLQHQNSHHLELEAEFPARGFFNMVTGYKTGELHLGRRTFLAAWLQIMQAW